MRYRIALLFLVSILVSLVGGQPARADSGEHLETVSAKILAVTHSDCFLYIKTVDRPDTFALNCHENKYSNEVPQTQAGHVNVWLITTDVMVQLTTGEVFNIRIDGILHHVRDFSGGSEVSAINNNFTGSNLNWVYWYREEPGHSADVGSAILQGDDAYPLFMRAQILNRPIKLVISKELLADTTKSWERYATYPSRIHSIAIDSLTISQAACWSVFTPRPGQERRARFDSPDVPDHFFYGGVMTQRFLHRSGR